MIELSEPVVAVTGELRRADKVPIFDGSGYVLEGEVYHDARGRFEDSTLIRTSPVVARRDEGRVFITQNEVYHVTSWAEPICVTDDDW